MNTPDEIRHIAQQRLDEAEILFRNAKYDGAFYLAGYSVELSLKARICERFDLPNMFNESDTGVNAVEGIGELRKMVKTHNLYILLTLSGLRKAFRSRMALDKDLSNSVNLVFGMWNESVRYKPQGYITKENIGKIINLLTGNNNLLTWIKTQKAE